MKQQSQTTKLIKKVLGHMDHREQQHHHGGILLEGDPGIGKTTFVEMLGSLLGIKTIVIEVPHITEEHLINIPFVVYNPASNASQTMTSQMTPEYKLVLAQSNLYTQISAAQPMNDQQYLQHIKRAPPYIQQLFQEFGGTETTIPHVFQQARNNFHSILFLDEYYRQTSMRIRNILRGILNNKIGIHPIPATTYVMYASNMKDTGLEDIPSNHQFTSIEFKTPTAKDWFNWLEHSVEQKTGKKLNEQVLKTFKNLLDDQHISYVDAANDVRTSPRRWEQLILYVNSSIPVNNAEEGRALLTNVKHNFVNYQTEQHSDLSKKVVDAVSKLIEQTSKIDVKNTSDKHDWRGTLLHQVQQKMKMGDSRKYIPVVSGPPGIGKTSQALAVAEQLGLQLIDIDVSEVFSDDVVGLPLPGKRSEESVEVKFSLPKLYHQIMTQIKEKDAQHIAQLKKEHGQEAQKYIESYNNQRWKYLIFFDEINRVDEKTFNSLRKVILEKNFGPSGDSSGELLELPKQAIVVAAMNPEGVGTNELTHHFKDVVDVIPARASWQQTRSWLNNKTFKNVNENIKHVALNIIDAFIEKFKSHDGKYTPEEAPFHIDIGTDLYISPREYTDMFATLIRQLSMSLKEIMSDPTMKDSQVRNHVDEAIGEALEDSLNFIFHKHGVEKNEFMSQLKAWVETLDDKVLAGLISKKAKASTVGATLGDYLDKKDITTLPDDVQLINVNTSVNNQQFIDQVRDMLNEKLKDDQSVKKYILDQTQPKVQLKGDKLVTNDSQKVSRFENFVLGMLYTLHIHQFQNDRLLALGKAMSTSLSEIINRLSKEQHIDDETKDEVVNATVELRSDIHDVASSL